MANTGLPDFGDDFSGLDRARMLVICPHPDDETLATGLLLQEAMMRASEVRIICLTDGERNPIPQFLAERSLSRERWATRRRQEARAACETLGIPDDCVEFWALPDQKLRRYVYALTRELRDTINRFDPTLIVAPSIHDLHDDHVAAGIAAAAAASARKRMSHLSYVVHGDEVDEPAFVVSTTSEALRRKFAALECHASQLIASRARMEAICGRTEAFRDLASDTVMPPTRFRAARRIWRILFDRPVPPPAVRPVQPEPVPAHLVV